MTFQLRKRLWPDRDLGEFARDVAQALGEIVPAEIVRYSGLYREPMLLGLKRKPIAIELIRITQQVRPEDPVVATSMVDWAWKPLNGGAQIASITGLTPSASIQYDFIYRVTYEV